MVPLHNTRPGVITKSLKTIHKWTNQIKPNGNPCLKVEERKRTYTEYAEQNECPQLDQIPRIVVFDVEHDEMVVSKRIEGAEDESSRQSTEEGAPERLQRKVVAPLDRNKTSQSNFM